MMTKSRAARRPVGRVVKKTVYGVRHLKRYYPEGFERAFERYKENVAQDTYRMDEIMESLKGFFEAAGVKMKDWEIGAYSYSSLEAGFPSHDYDEGEAVGKLKGRRAFAWMENNVLSPLRAPWGLPRLKKGDKLPDGFTRSWVPPSKDHPYGLLDCEGDHKVTRWTRPGCLRECPFTGVCYDMAFIDAVFKSLKSGETLREAFEGLADEARRLIEAEDEYDSSEPVFIDAAEANGWEWTREGEMAR